MNKPRNPFILGHYIERPYFCDREKEQYMLEQALLNGRNVVLISARRMGKTSLAHVTIEDSNQINEEYLTFFVDILQTNSLAEFTYLLGKAVFDRLSKKSESRTRAFLAALKSLKGSFGFDPISGTPTFNVQLGDIVSPEYTLDEIFSFIRLSDKPIIIVIDEFQQITHYPEKNIEAILRSHIQMLHNVVFVFAGSEKTILQEMFVSAKRPFYNSAEIMHLSPIPKDTYISFAGNFFREYGKDIEDSAIERAYDIMGGNTYYIQRIMNGAFAETHRQTKYELSMVKGTIKTMLATNGVIYREILGNISASQKSTIFAIAREKIVANPMSGAFIRANRLVSPSSVQGALAKLQKNGIVTKEDNGYTLSDPLLRIFINDLYFEPEI